MKLFWDIKLLETLTSALYEDPIVLFREYVQNSLDAYSMARQDNEPTLPDFRVKINYDMFFVNKNIAIIDNGYGIKPENFDAEMKTIGGTKKREYKKTIGFLGIGRLAAMPLCDTLIFTNKYKGSKKIQKCIWDGKRFTELLRLNQKNDVEEKIDEICKIVEFDVAEIDISTHYFQVDIINYHGEIENVMHTPKFIPRLCKMLPLEYSENFTHQNEILAKYKDYFGEDYSYYTIKTLVNENQIFKPYSNADILESGIFFWELRMDSADIDSEKLGLLWFTFNRKIKYINDNNNGILVRSKNVLMGDNMAFLNASDFMSSDELSTYREMAQGLGGVKGELLLVNSKLQDNARRDWFKINEELFILRKYIHQFLNRLHNYRYAASKFFRKNNQTYKTEKTLRETFVELTDGSDIGDLIVIKTSSSTKTNEGDSDVNQNSIFFSDVDIPTFNNTYKGIYDEIIGIIQEYYYLEKNSPEEFFRIRNYIKKELNEKQKKD